MIRSLAAPLISLMLTLCQLLPIPGNAETISTFDPTRPLSTGVGISHGNQWLLTSTLISAGRTRAVINGVTVTGPGQKIFGATVKQINPGSVVLQTEAGLIELVLFDRAKH